MSKDYSFEQLNEADQDLVLAAQSASRNAYAPYSGFAVGAAVRTNSEEILSAANFENASYGLSTCAEVSVYAVANAIDRSAIETIAVVGHRFLSPKEASLVVTPCGRCRQIIMEFAQLHQIDTRVLACSGDLRRISISAISELLTDPFGPANLGLLEDWPKMKRILNESTNETALFKVKNSA